MAIRQPHAPVAPVVSSLIGLASRLADLVLAPRCMACDAYLRADDRGRDACAPCHGTVFPIEGPRCPRCALPREPVAGRRVLGADDLCRDCALTERHFERVEACWEYDGAVADALRRAKFGGDLASLRALSRQARPWWAELRGRLLDAAPGGWRFTTVPPHPADLRRRGFDSPALLSRWLAPQLDWEQPLVRRARRAARIGHDRASRTRHARHAFQLSDQAHLAGRWLVFDDVLTTGATLDAVSRALRGGGAGEVVGVVLARTPRPSS